MVSMVGYGGMSSEKYHPRFELGFNLDQDDENSGKEIIHSGHFMVSDIDDSAVQEEDEAPSLVVHESDCDQDTSPKAMECKDFDFDTECKETSKTYTFGPSSSHTISIDASLTKLFECMSLAYSGKLTSPRWKQFKGLKLRLKDKIRLNNIIWRAWHIQFVAKKKPLVCQFASPLDVDVHVKPEALLLEGKYWRRQAASVTAEYKKWRMYFKGQSKAKISGGSDSMEMDWDFRFPSWSNCSLPDDDFFMDFTDTLFSSSHQSFDYPNSRDIGKVGIADLIQPGLGQLQPALDDFMQTFEPLQNFLWSRLPSLPEEGPIQDFFTSKPQPTFAGNSQTSVYSSSTSNNPGPTTAAAAVASHPSNSGSSPSEFLTPSEPLPSLPTLPTITASLSDSALFNTKGFMNSSLLPDLLLNASKSSIPSSVEQPLSLTSSLIASPSLPVNRPPPGPSLFAFQTNQRLPEASKNYPMASLLTAQGNMLPRGATLLNTTLAQVPLMKAQPQSAPKSQRKAAIKSGPLKMAEPPLSKHSTKPYPTFQAPPANSSGSGSSSRGSTTTTSTTTSATGEFTVPSPPQEEVLLGQNATALVSVKPKRTNTRAEPPVFRRHSYTARQPSVTDILSPNCAASAVVLVPTDTKSFASDTKFAVPQAKPRVRSRSMSSPQNSNGHVLLAAKPAQALSLTNISATMSPLLVASTSSPPVNSLPAPATSQLHKPSVRTEPSSAGLAQLLTTGGPFSQQQQQQQAPSGSGQPLPPPPSLQVSSSGANTVPPTVTIISTLPASSSSNTLLLPPLTLTASTVSTVSSNLDLPKSVMVNSLSSMFGNPVAQRISLRPTQIMTTNGASSSPATAASPPLPPPSPNSLSSCNPLASPAGPSAEPGGSQVKAFRPKSDEERVQYKEHRRVCHINAEQKRRCNIKHGFEALHHLLPSLCHSPNSKVSKAAMLQKAVDHIRNLKAERQHQLEETIHLQAQIESLHQTINLYQSQLPATGAPVPCQRNNQLKEMYEEHIRVRTLQNWKYWVFSLFMEPLLESYSTSVNTNSMEELCKSLFSWLEQNCSLASLRPVVLNSLRQLSTKTNILIRPGSLPEEATKAVTKKEGS